MRRPLLPQVLRWTLGVALFTVSASLIRIGFRQQSVADPAPSGPANRQPAGDPARGDETARPQAEQKPGE